MRTRSLTIAGICALVGGMLAPLSIGQLTSAMPIGAVDPATAPPDDSGTPGIDLVDGLGSGGQPDDMPRELVIADARFLFDRIVPLNRQELVRVAQEHEAVAYATTEEGPFAAIYLSVPNRSEDELARYLPEHVGSSDVACPAEAGDHERVVDAGGTVYAFAGIETDLTEAALQEAGDNNGEPIYSDLNSAQPFPELFFRSGERLLRFVLVGADGRPSSIAESLAFNGAEFAFASDATDVIDPASLTKIGCSTAFPVYAAADAPAGALAQLYVLAGTRFFVFTGEALATADETTEPPGTTTSTITTTLPPTTTTSTTTLPPTTSTTSLPPTTSTTTLPPTTSTTTPPPTTTTTLPSTTTTTTLPPTTTTPTTSTTTLPPVTTEPPTTTTPTTEPPTTTTPTTEPPTISTSTTTTEPSAATTTTTAGIEPPAVVSTLPPNAPSPAASTVVPPDCTGDPGELDTQGIPAHLPTRIQLGGVAYLFVRAEPVDAVGTLTRVGCVGPFESVRSDQADQTQVIYLRSTGAGTAGQQVYRFDVALTYQIQFQVTGQPQVITAADQSYRLGQVWQPSVYSSTSAVLFVQDPVDPDPEVIYGINVSQTVVGDVIGEYQRPGETAQPSDEITAAAEEAGLNPDLTINGDVYILANVYAPTGTTRNGFMTLFGSDASSEVLLGRDLRELDLFIFVLEAPAETVG